MSKSAKRVLKTAATDSEAVALPAAKGTLKAKGSARQPVGPADAVAKGTKRKADSTALTEDPVAKGKKARTELPSPAPSLLDDENEGELDHALAGFEDEEDGDDEVDSSDDEQGPTIDVKALPKPSTTLPRAKAAKAVDQASRVIYLGRIPKGFYEDQMRAYFKQFGDIEKLRLSRNKRTGAPKHYAFIRFALSEVAEIVAETMDNYLLAGHILQCKIVPRDKLHPRLWAGQGRKYRAIPESRQERLKHDGPKTEAQQKRIQTRLETRDAAKRAKIAELGIDYQPPKVKYSAAAASATAPASSDAPSRGISASADELASSTAQSGLSSSSKKSGKRKSDAQPGIGSEEMSAKKVKKAKPGHAEVQSEKVKSGDRKGQKSN